MYYILDMPTVMSNKKSVHTKSVILMNFTFYCEFIVHDEAAFEQEVELVGKWNKNVSFKKLPKVLVFRELEIIGHLK